MPWKPDARGRDGGVEPSVEQSGEEGVGDASELGKVGRDSRNQRVKRKREVGSASESVQR